MIPVNSSRFKHMGFEPAHQGSSLGKLHVIFADGTQGYYEDVPIERFRLVRDDPKSKGAALHQEIISEG